MNGRKRSMRPRIVRQTIRAKGIVSINDPMRDRTIRVDTGPRVDAPRRIEKIGVNPERMGTRS